LRFHRLSQSRFAGERARHGNSVMPSHFIFVRFFFDWPVDYPFERVVNLNDEEFDQVVKQIGKERSKLQRKRDKQQGIKRYTVEEWNAGALAVPPGNPPPRPTEQTTHESAAQTPDVHSRYPVALIGSRKRAGAVCKALQNRVNELKSGALLKTRLDDESLHFVIANPWFSVVGVRNLAPDEIISIQDKLDRLFEPLGPIPTVEEALLHPYLPEIKRILERSGIAGSKRSAAAEPETPEPFAAPNPTESLQLQSVPEGVPIMITRQMRSDLNKRGYDDAAIDKMKPATAWSILQEQVKSPAQTRAAEPATPEMTAKRGGRPRSPAVDEVQAYLYGRWIKGDKLTAIRTGAERIFGRARAPKEDAHVTEGAHRYARRNGLPKNRPK
jgi:hypothetical protein